MSNAEIAIASIRDLASFALYVGIWIGIGMALDYFVNRRRPYSERKNWPKYIPFFVAFLTVLGGVKYVLRLVYAVFHYGALALNG